MRGAISVIVAALATASPAAAQAPDAFLALGVELTGPFADVAPGADASTAFYAAILPELAFGLRVRAGGAPSGAAAQDRERALMDFGLIAAAVRVRPFARLMDDERSSSGWMLELAPGGALLDGAVVPVYELATGYGFSIESIVLAPVFRFTHALDPERRFGDPNVLTWAIGFELIVDPPAR